MLTKCSKHFRRTKATRLPCHPEGPIGQRTSSRCSPSGRTRATSLKSLLKYLDESRVEAEGRMEGSERGASVKWTVTTERRGKLPFCLAPSTVALIFGVGL